MGQHISTAEWDVYAFGIPLIALLIFTFFRLDQVFAARKKNPSPPPAMKKKEERSMHSDPDGRPWDD